MMTTTPRILAVCIHNSARSQMTEEYIRLACGDLVHVESAGILPGNINPVVAELLLQDEGIDIRHKPTQSVFELLDSQFDYVIAVCDKEAAEKCPVFPAEKERLHWPFPDPSKAKGNMEERMNYIRPIRDEIKAKVDEFVRQHQFFRTRSNNDCLEQEQHLQETASITDCGVDLSDSSTSTLSQGPHRKKSKLTKKKWWRWNQMRA